MIIIIDLSYIMYNDLWMWNKTKLNWTHIVMYIFVIWDLSFHSGSVRYHVVW
jgi:hypothetical protein